VEQYLKILYPSKEMLAELSNRAQEGAKGATLEQSRKYARWERLKREKDKKRQDDQEAEKRTLLSLVLTTIEDRFL
jgi:splicing factor 3A subunit 1